MELLFVGGGALLVAGVLFGLRCIDNATRISITVRADDGTPVTIDETTTDAEIEEQLARERARRQMLN